LYQRKAEVLAAASLSFLPTHRMWGHPERNEVKYIEIARLPSGMYLLQPGYDMNVVLLTANELLDLFAWIAEHKADLEAETQRNEKEA